MAVPLGEIGWTSAIVLGLYGFYCNWEASRAGLAAMARQVPGSVEPQARAYRLRARLAWLAGGLVALMVVGSAL